MIAAGFNTIEGKVPNPEMTNAIRAEPLSSGLFLLTSGVYGKVIRFRVPLTIPDDVVAEALDILEASIDEGVWSLLRSWLRPHRGISQEHLPFYLACFEFIHNIRGRGKALLPSLLQLIL